MKFLINKIILNLAFTCLLLSPAGCFPRSRSSVDAEKITLVLKDHFSQYSQFDELRMPYAHRLEGSKPIDYSIPEIVNVTSVPYGQDGGRLLDIYWLGEGHEISEVEIFTNSTSGPIAVVPFDDMEKDIKNLPEARFIGHATFILNGKIWDAIKDLKGISLQLVTANRSPLGPRQALKTVSYKGDPERASLYKFIPQNEPPSQP